VESLTFECEVGERILKIETGKLAQQANGAVTVRYGDTVVLVTACVGEQPREGVDFLPLTIDYEERLYAAGKIPGGFIRREGRPSQEATLAMRLTDRPLRPLLPKKWRKDIQLVITVLSADQENDPNILAVIGGSCVLSISEVPFAGPVSAVNIGYIDNKLVLNPTMAQLDESQLDLIVASTKEAVVMVEAGAKEVSEDIVAEAIRFGHQANQSIISLQEQLKEACGKDKAEAPASEMNPEATEAVASIVGERLSQALGEAEKPKREAAMGGIKQECLETLGEKFPEADIKNALDDMVHKEIRRSTLETGRRVGGRGITEVRPISCEVGLLPRTHGSAVFLRGQTQVLTITTLGSTKKRQQLDGLGIEDTKGFMHHYNFPPFSSGEVRRIGTPKRREIGHGALAERALLPILPKEEDFPYTIRLVSEVLSSSGSTSMASVCASSLSLMDAGIPVTRAVAGIAMGLMAGDDGKHVILTDIEGIEDAHGDMDFKIAGTSEGITALQMDTKLKGIDPATLEEALRQGKDARLFIMDVMQRTIISSRPEVSAYAPRLYKLTIPPEKIGAVIGTGGKTIRSITEETQTTIDVENDGSIIVYSPDKEGALKAIQMIENLTKDVEVGDIYTGKVTRLLNFGAFVEILPKKEGLVHISELADHRVASVGDVVKTGDEITVKVIGIDDMGRVNLSRRAAFDKSTDAPDDEKKRSPDGGHPSHRQHDSHDRDRGPRNHSFDKRG